MFQFNNNESNSNSNLSNNSLTNIEEMSPKVKFGQQVKSTISVKSTTIKDALISIQCATLKSPPIVYVLATKNSTSFVGQSQVKIVPIGASKNWLK